MIKPMKMNENEKKPWQGSIKQARRFKMEINKKNKKKDKLGEESIKQTCNV